MEEPEEEKINDPKQDIFRFFSPEEEKIRQFTSLYDIKPLRDDRFDYETFYNQSTNAYWYTLQILQGHTFDNQILRGVINYLTWISAYKHYKTIIQYLRQEQQKLKNDHYFNTSQLALNPNTDADLENVKQHYLTQSLIHYEPLVETLQNQWKQLMNLKPIEPPENPFANYFNKNQKLDPKTHNPFIEANNHNAWLNFIKNLKFQTQKTSRTPNISIPKQYQPAYKNWIYVTNLIATNDRTIAAESIKNGNEKYYIPEECYRYLQQLIPLFTYNPAGQENTENHFVFI